MEKIEYQKIELIEIDSCLAFIGGSSCTDNLTEDNPVCLESVEPFSLDDKPSLPSLGDE
jgi:hypothetical protein